MTYTCPVCGYPWLVAPPADYMICPSCGTEFGNDDATATIEELRRDYLAVGTPWFSGHTPKPSDWSTPMTHEPTFTPAADVIEALLDGSGHVVVARAGEPIPWARAVMLGLVAGEALPIDPAILDALRGADVPPGVLAHDLAHPGAILNEENRDAGGAVVARAKQLRKRHGSTGR